MRIQTKISILTLLLIFSLALLPVPAGALGSLPASSGLSVFTSGVDSGKNGEPVFLRELDLAGLETFPIVQQPNGNSVFVSSGQNYVTEYQTASKYGSVGLLAHNYLAGQYFFRISQGQEIKLAYSDGSSRTFVVTNIQRYQALTPDSPSSDFIDLRTGENLTATQLFWKTYGKGTGYLILQTCIFAEENPSWGRLFVIAEPIEQVATR